MTHTTHTTNTLTTMTATRTTMGTGSQVHHQANIDPSLQFSSKAKGLQQLSACPQVGPDPTKALLPWDTNGC